MIYITGDTHGQLDLDKIVRFSKTEAGKKLTKNDYLIVLGDFGCCWIGNVPKNSKRYKELKDSGFANYDKSTRAFWEKMPWTTLFVDGNHENFDALNAYPVTEWNGGKIHQISKSIIHLMRGQVFNIEGHTFFTMGGASSIDKWNREEGISWWPEELPSAAEYQEALDNLEKHDMTVDYVLSHCAPEKYCRTALKTRDIGDFGGNELTRFFDHLILDWGFKFQHWYFGHYHFDEDIRNFHIMYYVIRPLDPLKEDKKE